MLAVRLDVGIGVMLSGSACQECVTHECHHHLIAHRICGRILPLEYQAARAFVVTPDSTGAGLNAHTSAKGQVIGLGGCGRHIRHIGYHRPVLFTAASGEKPGRDSQSQEYAMSCHHIQSVEKVIA